MAPSCIFENVSLSNLLNFGQEVLYLRKKEGMVTFYEQNQHRLVRDQHYPG